MKTYIIVRYIRERFEVKAPSYDDACELIASGDAGDSFDLGDTYELVEERDG